jgi:uncharacterized protein YlbG (UPF0298 family)
MAEDNNLEISVTEEEKMTVLIAIRELDKIGHLRYMSQAMVAVASSLKATKVRIVLQCLLDEKRIKQYDVSNGSKLRRYYYTIAEQAVEAEQALNQGSENKI